MNKDKIGRFASSIHDFEYDSNLPDMLTAIDNLPTNKHPVGDLGQFLVALSSTDGYADSLVNADFNDLISTSKQEADYRKYCTGLKFATKN